MSADGSGRILQAELGESADAVEPPEARRSRPRRALEPALPIVATVLLLAAWWGIKAAFGLDTFVLPSPGDVARSIVEEWEALLSNGLTTLWETLAGFILAVVIAVPLGVSLAYSWIMDRMFSPILFGFNAVPKIAIAPLLVVWMGFGQLPKVVMVVLVCFFPIVLSTAAGMRQTPEEIRELIRSLKATWLQEFLKVRLPAALPHIFVGLKVAISLAVIGAVIGEFVGATSGLGYLIVASGGSADTPLAFAALAALAAISVALFYSLRALEKWLVPWAAND